MNTKSQYTEVGDPVYLTQPEHKSKPQGTLNSAYIEVAFKEKLAIMKENLCTKCFPLTVMLKTLPIMKFLYEITAYNDLLDT